MEILIVSILIVGMIIFLISFVPQVTRIYKGKATVGMSPLS